jgi:hypothetical protein
MTSLIPARKESQPYRPADHQYWGSALVEDQHVEALYMWGELAVYTLMWRPIDHEQGLVDRCPRCFDGAMSRQARAFGQATESECPECYGTTFEDGFRAQIIRPTIFADRNSEMRDESRGTVVSDTIMVDTTGDFTMHKGDYIFRYDNTRWQVEEKREAVVRPGFGPPQHVDSFAGTTTARRDDQTTVSFKIPPTDPIILRDVLGTYGGAILPDLDLFTVVRPGGYLIEGGPPLDSSVVGGLAAVKTGHGVPDPDDFEPNEIYLDLDTGILYKVV